jgi:hypothetical protein
MNLVRAVEQPGPELRMSTGPRKWMRRHEPMKVAAVLAWIASFGFGLPQFTRSGTPLITTGVRKYARSSSR